jgi:hypothetical protein
LPKVLESLALAALLVALAGFPAELFNSTYEENEARIQRRLPKLLRRLAPDSEAAAKPALVVIFFAVSATFTALVDPGFNLGWSGATTFTGFAIAIPLTVAVNACLAELYKRRTAKEAGRFQVVRAALLVAVVLTAMSRLVHFVPGYVYGLIAGFSKSRKASESQEAKSILAGAAGVFALSVAAWIGWGRYAAVALGPHASHGAAIAGAVLAQLAALGVTSLVFGLMPFTFMEGYSLRTWSLRAWIAVYAVAAFSFALVLIRSNNELLTTHQTPAGLLEPFILFGVFGVLSVLFWLYFRLHPSPEEAEKGQDAEKGPGAEKGRASAAEAAGRRTAPSEAERADAGGARTRSADSRS